MKVKYLYYTLLFFVQCQILAQNEGEYKLTIYENYAYGEASPTGKYSIKMNSNTNEEIVSLDYDPNSKKARIKYKVFINKPFLNNISKLNKIDRPYFNKSDESNFNDQIDTLYNKVSKILSKYQNEILNTNSKKNNFITSIIIAYKSDTIVNILNTFCEWDPILKDTEIETKKDICWKCKFRSTDGSISYYKHGKIVKKETVDFISTNEFKKYEDSWNNDSTFLTRKVFDSNNSLTDKKLYEYSKGLFVSTYIINSETGEKNKVYGVIYQGNNIKEEIEFNNNDILSKICYKYDSNNNVIEKLSYQNYSSSKGFVLIEGESNFLNNEYNQDNKLIKQTIISYSKIPISSTRYYYGTYK